MTPKKPRKAPQPATVSQCVRWAERGQELLEQTAAGAHSGRVEPKGMIVARFGLPLHLCQPQNRRCHQPGWVYRQIRNQLFELMAAQQMIAGRFLGDPLPGRPQVRCARFSPRATDAYADWAKQAVDILCPSVVKRTRDGGFTKTSMGLGIIAGDSPELIAQHQWCEPAKPKLGFVYIEVRTGS